MFAIILHEKINFGTKKSIVARERQFLERKTKYFAPGPAFSKAAWHSLQFQPERCVLSYGNMGCQVSERGIQN